MTGCCRFLVAKQHMKSHMSAGGCQLAKFTNISGKFPNLEKISSKSLANRIHISGKSKSTLRQIRQISGTNLMQITSKFHSNALLSVVTIFSSTSNVFKSTTRLKSKVFSLERLWTFVLVPSPSKKKQSVWFKVGRYG